mmetsp:Transcript_1887/g.11369  ORF Transcript_1887/g.11369 Transcript_1887/m.11369 type:complete len:271 (-) Transcript_1887:2533-3345(-)
MLLALATPSAAMYWNRWLPILPLHLLILTYWTDGWSFLVPSASFHVQLVTVATRPQVTKTTIRSRPPLRRHLLHCAIFSMEPTPFVRAGFQRVPRRRSRVLSARARVHLPLRFLLLHEHDVVPVHAFRPRRRRTSRCAAATRPRPPLAATKKESVFSRGARPTRSSQEPFPSQRVVDDDDHAHQKLLGRVVVKHGSAHARQQEGRLRVRVRRGSGMVGLGDVQGASSPPQHVDGTQRTIETNGKELLRPTSTSHGRATKEGPRIPSAARG